MPTAGLVHVRRFAKRSAKYVAVLTSLAVLASGLEVVDSSGAEAAVAADPKAAPEKVTSRPDVVSASVSARTQGSRVEVESMRTETSTTWVEPSGVMSTEAHAGPIRFKDAGGTWRDVDLTLGKAVDGTVAPMGHKWGLTLGRANSQPGGVLASVQVGSGRQVEWVSPWALPAPVLDGTKVTYGDVQPGVDLVLDARRTGFEQDMVIKSRPAQAPVWRIPLRTKGLRPVARRDGTIDFTDAKGTVVSTIPVARMWDAKVDPDTGEHPNQTSVKVTVEQVSPGRATLVIEPDAAWLAASDREFPVTVDPTYSQGTTYATFDTWVQSNVTTDESASAELRAGYNGSAIGRSYLNFPIDNIKGKQIVGASLLLYETYSQSCTPTTVIAQNSGSASTSTRWTSQPTRYTTQSGSLSAAKGFSGSCPAGRISIPITDVVKGWAGTTYQYSSLAVVGGNESDVSSWKRFDSLEAANDPYVAFSWNRAPSTPTAPVFTSAVSYAPPGVSTSSLYTAYTRPWVTTKASDADGNTVRYDIEFHNSTTVSGTSLKGACSSATYPSGTTAGCQLTNADLPDNSTIYARARTWDGLAYSAWSGWTTVRVAATNPAAPVVSCPSPYTKDSWQDATPTGTGITCTITATGTGYNAPGYVRATVDGALYPTNFTGGAAGQIKITPSSDSAVAKTTVTIKLPAPSGLHTINVKAESPSGRLSTGSGTEYDFGWGGTALTSPAVSPRVTTTGGVKIAASGPPKGSGAVPTAKIRWRISGYDRGNSESIGWNDGPDLSVTDNGTAGVTVTGIWDTNTATVDSQLDSDPNTSGVQPTTLNNRVPVLLDAQVCLAYSTATQCTWSQQQVSVLRVPHAFGDGFPTSAAGPGQVALWTGEFNLDSSDISVPGYTGDLSLSRSHSTYAGATDTVNGVFGPGWTAHFDGADAGVAGMQVVDSTRVDGTIALVDGDGSALVYTSPNGQRRTTNDLQTGTWVPADEDTELDAAKLTVTGTGASTAIVYTEDDGLVTTFVVAAAPQANADAVFKPGSIAEPGVSSKTTYSYDASGRVSRILAPVPPGVTCPATGTLNPGCRALHFDYGTSGSSAGRLVNAWLDIYNPAKAGGPGMDSIKVATYTYDASGRLATANDPRSNLTTSYGYNASNHLTTINPPGLKPLQFNYVTVDQREKLASVTRERPATDTNGGTATLASFVYDVPTSGSGLPDLSQTSVARWNQKVVPTTGFAVFGADHPVSSTDPAQIGSADWAYADLQYTDSNGYTVNTAKYGAGDWQFTATDYNEQGNTVRELDERALRKVIDENLPAGEADQYASVTVYNGNIMNAAGDTVVTPAGTLVTDTYGPARMAALKDGSLKLVRTHTHTDYDGSAPNAGINPDTTLPYRLPTRETTSVQDPGTGGDLEIVSRTLTDYGPPVTGDADGWSRGLAGKTITDVDLDGTNSAGDIVRVTRYDAEGRAIETRQPKSASGDGTDAGTTKTVYYSAAPGVECGDKPEWAGLVCKTYPGGAPTSAAGQPGTPTLPTTSTTGFTYLLQPTTVVETSGAVTRTSTTTYLLDGRTDKTSLSVTGLAGSTPNTSKQTTYDSATGLATVVTARNADDSVAGTITTEYDTWGRQISYQPSGDAATTTSYHASGAVKTVTDPNGSTTYTYDGTDAAGRVEHRGLTTKVDVTTAGSTWSSTGAYDADGAMTVQKLPGGITQTTTLDNAGEPIGLTYSGQVTTVNDDGTTTVDPNGGWLSWSLDNDVAGRVTHEWTPEGAAFTGPANGGPNDVGDAIPYDRAYAYDNAGRLVQVKDRTAVVTGVDVADPTQAPCVTRTYGFDGNDNRQTKSSATSGADGACTTTAATTVTRAFDSADRPTTGAGGQGAYDYDQLGRTLTLPASDAPHPQDGNVTLGYYDNDLARSITQAGTTTSFTLDALDRRAVETVTDASGSKQTIRHYTDTSDNPTWVTQGATTQRYAELIGSDLAFTVTQDGAANLTLANPHGDIVTTVDMSAANAAATSVTGWNSYDEYGSVASNGASSTGAIQYAWLGGKQRAATGAGLLLMGVRLYNSATGLFTSNDPLPGGNSNRLEYPSDPVNSFDLDGRFGWGKWLDRAATGLAVAGMFGCAVCAGVSAAISMGRGIYKVTHHDRSGWIDIAGSVFYGGAKAARIGGKIWKSSRMRKFPRGGRSARANKRHRQRLAKKHRRYERRVVRRADWLDRWYGYGTVAYSAYGWARGHHVEDW